MMYSRQTKSYVMLLNCVTLLDVEKLLGLIYKNLFNEVRGLLIKMLKSSCVRP
jgi:hypothetical protein